MSSNLGVMSNLGILVPAVESRTTEYNRIYNENCHRIYSLAFWMTDNELTAEQLAANVFLRAFASNDNPQTEQIDQALLAEVREMMPVGTLTLNCKVSETASVRAHRPPDFETWFHDGRSTRSPRSTRA